MTPFPQPCSFALSNESVLIRTMEGRIDSWNHSAEKLYGWRQEEAIGKISHELLKTQFPQPLDEIETELVRVRRWEGELIHTTRDGGRVVVESRWMLAPPEQAGRIVEINRVRQKLVPAGRLDDLLPTIATIVLAAGSVFCMLVSLHSLYREAWTAEREFLRTWRIVLYGLLPALLAGLLLASLRLPPHLRTNLAILLCSAGVATYRESRHMSSSLPGPFGPRCHP